MINHTHGRTGFPILLSLFMSKKNQKQYCQKGRYIVRFEILMIIDSFLFLFLFNDKMMVKPIMAYKCIQKEQKIYHTHNLHYRTHVLYIKGRLTKKQKNNNRFMGRESCFNQTTNDGSLTLKLFHFYFCFFLNSSFGLQQRAGLEIFILMG